jgi:hypothetical protein
MLAVVVQINSPIGLKTACWLTKNLRKEMEAYACEPRCVRWCAVRRVPGLDQAGRYCIVFTSGAPSYHGVIPCRSFTHYSPGFSSEKL